MDPSCLSGALSSKRLQKEHNVIEDMMKDMNDYVTHSRATAKKSLVNS
jgi:hypothetical protein